MTDDTPLAPTDAELLGLNVGEVYFSESPSKYPEVHGTQYHAGAPGVLAFAREVLAKWGAQPIPSSAAEFALQALVAAGHVSQELVDRALALPGAPQTQQLGWVYCYQGQEPAFSYTPQPPGIPKTHYWQVPVFDIGQAHTAQEEKSNDQ